MYDNASYMQPEAYLLTIPTIVSGADQLLMLLGIFIKRYGGDGVGHAWVCWAVLIWDALLLDIPCQ